MPDYVVLVATQRDESKALLFRASPPISAPSADAAVAKLREQDAEVKMNRDAHFVTMPAGRFAPKRMRRRLVETWELAAAELPDDAPQGDLGV